MSLVSNVKPDSSIPNARILREASLVEPIIRNPFVHKPILTFTDKLKIGINGVILMPIRVISITVVVLFAVVVATAMTAGYSDEDLKKKPLTGWRKSLKGVLRFCGRSIAFCFGFHKIKKNGRRATRAEAPIFVAAPHSSFLDAFVFFVLGLPSGVSKSENAKIPIVGRLIRAAQPILVTREDSKNKLLTIEEIKRRSNPESDWPQVLVFPEGTTTNRCCLITFKAGAFIPGLPVQPIVVEYKNKVDTITWTWEGINAAKVIFYTLCQFNNKMEITYLPVYNPDENEKHDAKLYANNVRTKIAEYLNVITTNHTFEDCRLMLKARELNLPFESGLIEFEKIKEKLNINYENCQDVLKKFTVFARKSNGKMSLKEFSSYLGLPPNGPVVQVFNLYDRDKDGQIDFREFLIGLSLLSQPVNTEETLKLAFDMFDNNGKGFISLADLQSIFFSAFSMPAKDVEILFNKIDTKGDGLITFDELKSYAKEKPEYARIFLVFNEIAILRNNMEIDRLASPVPKPQEDGSVSSSSSSTAVKRPMSDKTKSLTNIQEEGLNKITKEHDIDDDANAEAESTSSPVTKRSITKID